MTDVLTVPDPALIPRKSGTAPHTRYLLRRTGLIYAAVVALGVIPWLTDAPDGWKAFAAGLAFPGGGFATSFSWPALWLIPTLALVVVAGVAWFGSGMVIALPMVWIGSAVLAGVTAPDQKGAGYLTVLAVVLVIAGASRIRLSRRSRARTIRQEARNLTLARDVDAVRSVRARSIEALQGTTPELSASQTAGLRYAVDLALQPVDDWTGFNRIDIFQTSALRYQVNQLGWVLAVAQSAYAPSFRGYLSSGQRTLIERYLQPEVVGYWKWERLWGHLRWDADPVGRDNIMLTGYYGLNLALYGGNTGDLRYHQPDSLQFQVSDRRVYPHAADDLRDSLLANYANYADGFCLFPCEPNWSYSACNFRGAATLAAFDRVHGTSDWPDLRERFVDKLHTEFMTGDGGVVALRSTLTGLPVPFPMPDSVLPKELNPTSPELAERYWTLVRDEVLEKIAGTWTAKLDGPNVDFGNYTMSDQFALGGLYGSAQEMGDTEVAEAMLTAIEGQETRAVGPALWYPQRSTLFNATLAMDRLLRPGGWHSAINDPVPAETLRGPILSEVAYPSVLVLSTSTDGTALAVTLVPGVGPGRQTLAFDQLIPGRRYQVSNGAEVMADESGRATIEIDLSGRLELALSPIA